MCVDGPPGFLISPLVSRIERRKRDQNENVGRRKYGREAGRGSERERENGPEARQGLGAESYKGRYREKEEE